VLRGRGAKRGELRGAARARAGRGPPPPGGGADRELSSGIVTFGEDQRRAFGDYLELAMQSQYNKLNL
jgi:hypothetical protein